MNLELIAMRWLWLEKNCHYIVRERSPRSGMGEPDVLGVTAGRFLIEIETKRSLADFHADKQKWHRRYYEEELHAKAKFFYFMAPPDLAEKLKTRLPSYAGLLTVDTTRFGLAAELVPAPVNKAARKLSLKECVLLARQIVNYSMCLEDKYQEHFSHWKQGIGQYPMKNDFSI